MPKATFHRLSSEKKNSLMSTCFAEFANNSFAEASISSIVKSLGIAKGSIYQYFEDKHDLYAFLITESVHRKYAILDFVLARSSVSLEQWYFDACLAQIKFAQEFPQMYKLMRRATVEGDYSWEERDYQYIKEAINKLHSSETEDMISSQIFLLSAMKEVVAEKYYGGLNMQAMQQIEHFCKKTIQIVTN